MDAKKDNGDHKTMDYHREVSGTKKLRKLIILVNLLFTT